MAENFDLNDPENVEKLRRALEAQDSLTRTLGTTSKTLNSALSGSINTVLSFGKAVESSEKGLSKYNGTLTSAANAAEKVTGNFGTFGKALGAGAQAMSFMAQQVFAQSDRITKGFDQIAEVGGSARFTATQMMGFAKASGFSTFQLDAMGKAAKVAGEGLISVGGSVGAGFSKFTDVITKDIAGFRKLGYSVEQVMETQAMYIKQTSGLGISLNRPVEQLRKSSEEYMKNLIILADLSGQDIKAQQATLEFAAANENYVAKMYEMSQQEQDLRRAGKNAEADALRKQIDTINAVVSNLRSIFDDKQLTAVFESFASGGRLMTDEIVRMQGRNLDINTLVQNMVAGARAGKPSEKIFAEFQEANEASIRGQRDFIRNQAALGEAAKDGLGAFSIYNRNIVSAGVVTGKSMVSEADASRAGVEAQMKLRDKVMDNVAALEQFERNLQIKIDDVVKAFNPLITDTDKVAKAFLALGAAVAAATYALGALAAAGASRMGGGFGGGVAGGGASGGRPGAGAGGAAGGGGLGTTGMTKAQIKQYRKLRIGGMSEAQARGKILGVGALDAVEETAAIERATQSTKSTAGEKTIAGRVGRSIAGGGGAMMLGGYALSTGGELIGGPTGSAMDIGGQALSFAGSGAMAGAMFGPQGALIGGAIGGLIGLGKGILENKEALFDNTKSLTDTKEQLQLSSNVQSILDKAALERQKAFEKALNDNTKSTDKNTEDINAAARKELEGTFTEQDQKELDKRTEELNAYFKKHTKEVVEKVFAGVGEGGVPIYQDVSKRVWESTAAQKTYQQGLDVAQGLVNRKTQQRAGLQQLAAQTTEEKRQQQEQVDMSRLGSELGLGTSSRIVDLGRKLQGQAIPGFPQGFRISEHPAFGGVTPNTHKGQGHEDGRAIDINIGTGLVEAKDPGASSIMDTLAANLEGQGFRVLWKTQGHDNHMHVEVPKMAKGGIVNEPTLAMVGEGTKSELVQPLTPNSILETLASTPANTTSNDSTVITKMESVFRNFAEMNSKVTNDYIGKLDKVINILENSHTTQEKLLRVSR